MPRSILRARLLRDGEPGAAPGNGSTGGGNATAPQPPDPPAGSTGDGGNTGGDQRLGESGLKALQEERRERQALEKRLRVLEPLEQIATALGQGDTKKGQTEIEQLSDRLATHEQELTLERQARWRAELAHEHSLTPNQAKRLVGTTREEMAADAAELVADFAVQPNKTGANGAKPKPDRSQGGVPGGGAGDSKAAGLAEARRRFGDKTKTTTT